MESEELSLKEVGRAGRAGGCRHTQGMNGGLVDATRTVAMWVTRCAIAEPNR